MKEIYVLVIMFFLIIITGCEKEIIYENDYENKTKLTQVSTYCEYDSDCKIVDDGCCGAYAANKFFDRKKTNCNTVDCMEGYENTYRSNEVKCENNECEFK